MKQVTVIGGTGMLGAPVVRALALAGYRVRVVSRTGPQQQAKFAGLDQVELVTGDLMQPETLIAALADADFVHINVNGHDKKSYELSHLRGTENVLTALQGRKVQCISFTSNDSAYPQFSQRHDNRCKWEAEQLLKKSGQPYLALMPTWFMESLTLMTRKGAINLIGRHQQPTHFISAKDYGQLVVDCYEDKHCRNLRLPVRGPQAITLEQAVSEYARHHQLKIQRLPVWAAKFIGRISRTPELVDVADLMAHYERHGQTDQPRMARTQTSLAGWLAEQQMG